MELNNSFTKVDFNQYRDAYDKDVIQAWKERKLELDVETLRALMYGFTFKMNLNKKTELKILVYEKTFEEKNIDKKSNNILNTY